MQQQANTTASATTSEGEKVSEIQSLSLRVAALDQRVDWWNTAMIWALVFAALAAIAVVVTTRVALARAKQLARAQAELSRAKERQTELDLHSKDLRIAELNNENLKLQTTARYGLPRRIVMGDRDGDKEQRQARFKEVAKYAGTVALIQAVQEPEAQTLAFDIRTALNNSGWNAEVMNEAQSHIPSGFITAGVQVVTIEAFPFTPGPEPKPVPPTLSPAGHAAQALVNLLSLDLGPPLGPPFFGVHWQSEYLEQKLISKYGFEFPKGAVVVLVGMRPIEYSPVATTPAPKS